jgi:SAM-dependent methyltransferase
MATLHQTFEDVPVDIESMPQTFLDLELRGRTSIFPWRGQFSPCFVEVLLSEFSSHTDRVFDPFVGAGTTLFESARRQLASCGTEINPAAVAMAETVKFIRLNNQERSLIIQQAESLLDESLGSELPLFRKSVGDIKTLLLNLISEATSDLVRSLLINTLLRALKPTSPIDTDSLFLAFKQHAQIVRSLPITSKECSVSQADARRTGLANASVDLIITSPPYINVFNYHQNNRFAMELLGLDVLEVARSEFGSNRKNRGNRFLTVVQYCLDLHAALAELRRVIRPTGRAIFVVGRESKVRGVPFQNGSLVASLAEMTGFKLSLRQERKFKNMFGELIYEDILHIVPTLGGGTKGEARELAIQALRASLDGGYGVTVRNDLKDAIRAAQEVSQSPLFVRKQALSGEISHPMSGV